jgi:cholesterol transport system auxiliary component
MMPNFRMAAVAALALALAGCISFGKDPPETLFNLTPTTTASAGSGATGTVRQALAVIEPQAAAKLAVLRVPVQVNGASIAYLQNAQWVERPSRLFGRLLEETMRAKGNRLVLDGSDVELAATTKLSGELLEMGYDVPTGSVVVRYNGVLQLPDGQIRTRRFESSVPGVPAVATAVAPALNQAANDVANQVADWVG